MTTRAPMTISQPAPANTPSAAVASSSVASFQSKPATSPRGSPSGGASLSLGMVSVTR